MSVSHTSKIMDVPGLLSALRLSTEHLLQLIEMQAHSKNDNSSLNGPIERALAAHRQILSSLETALGTAEIEPAIPEAQVANPDVGTTPDANWVESPWQYLNIPTKTRGRLGPMPRFVPVPNPKKPLE